MEQNLPKITSEKKRTSKGLQNKTHTQIYSQIRRGLVDVL